ncbi:MAG: hypothetical protein EOL87_13815 [Spartobacteria bacterium]|nr:hypothetical protein [Spartobacteria bacterium]
MHPPPTADRSLQALIQMLNADVHTLALLSDDQLAKLATHPPTRTAEASIRGETLTRRWLYGSAINPDAEEKRTADYLRERISGFTHCDGLIPVTTGTQPRQAIPIPFTIRSEQNTCCATDLAGHSITTWEDVLSPLLRPAGCVMRLSIRIGTRDLSGASCGLPVYLAVLRHQGIINRYDPMRLLATGVIRNNVMQTTDDLEAKRQLAQRMNAQLFFSPGSFPDATHAHIPCGTPLQHIPAMIEKTLMQAGLGTMDSRQAIDLLEKIVRQVHEGTSTMDAAACILKRILKAFDDDSDGIRIPENKIKAILLQGSMYNHAGRPDEGQKYTHDALKLAEQHHKTPLFASAAAHQIVSLTDQGYIADAVCFGRSILQTLQSTTWQRTDDELLAYMRVYGALGGQALYQNALHSGCPDDAQESRAYLQKALEYARELHDPIETARDLTQIFLWQATFCSESAHDAYHDTLDALRRMHSDTAVSIGYLHRARFFGAYRHHLTTQHIPDDFTSWELPSDRIGHLSWVRATALKYRATLYAAAGQPQAAMADFEQSIACLIPEEAPLLQFIGATAALQAAQSLTHIHPQRSLTYKQQAQRLFRQLTDLFPEAFGIRQWIAYAHDPENRPNPQLTFAY